MPAQDLALRPEVTIADGAVVVHLRVPCDVYLDEVSRFSVGMYAEDAAFNLAYVIHCVRQEAAAGGTLTVLLYSVDEPSPIAEQLPRPQAEALFVETRDHGERWPAIVAAELVGPDGDCLDRW